MYIENSDLCNHADDSTLYASGESLSIIIENLKADFLRISRWFHGNFMVLIPDKCHFMGTQIVPAILYVMVQQWKTVKKTKF